VIEFVVYIDIDAFYVSCELRDRPDLVGKPVIVGPNPSRGPSRGVVLSASYEARAFGVRSAMPVGQAARLCPEATWIDPDFAKYGRVSRQVRELLEEEVAPVLPQSIDEVAMRLNVASVAEAESRGRSIQKLLCDRLSLPASIGIATNRVVAKIATDRAKPGGVLVVPPDTVKEFLAPLPVRAVPGVGPKTEAVLHQHGIERIGDLAREVPPSLRREMGGFATWIGRLAQGIVLPTEDHDEPGPRTRSVDLTFEEDSRDLGWIEGQLDILVDRLHAALSEEQLAYQTVTVALRWSDFGQTQRSRTLSGSSNTPEPMRATARRLLAELLATEQRGRARMARRISLRAERLETRTGASPPLERFLTA
jgi:nucleotidyltransferase/DNA polymerase involved in DNA repair